MGNMSYCRFQNTYNDLKDCYYALLCSTQEEENEEDELSQDEKEAKANLINLCKTIIDFENENK